MKLKWQWCFLSTLLFFSYSLISFADPTNTCPSNYFANLNQSYTEAIEVAGDIDVISITVPTSGKLTIYTTGTTDTYGDLKNSACTTIASNDDANGTRNFSISAIVSAGKYYISIRHFSATGTGVYGLSNTFVPSAVSSTTIDNVGNTCPTATTLLNNGSINSALDSAGDLDYFKLTLVSDSNLTVNTTGVTDTYGDLKDANCNTIASNDDNGSLNFSITKLVNAGTYYVAVRHYSATGTGAYTILNSVTPVITRSLAELATVNTLSSSELDHILVAHYTDPLTLPQTMLSCTHDHVVTSAVVGCTAWGDVSWTYPLGHCTQTGVIIPETRACDTWTSYKKVMNCDWYINAPVSSSMRFQVGALQTAYNTFISSLVNKVKLEIQSAITSALVDGAVSAAVAAFPSAGVGAAPTFVTVFGYAINLETVKAALRIKNWIDINKPVAEASVNLINSAFPTITANNLNQSCGWSDWTPI